MVRNYPRTFEELTVSTVRSSTATVSLPAISEFDFLHVLKRLFPTYNNGQLQHVLLSLRNRWGSDIDNRFVQKFSHENFRPRLHAEVSIMEHFHVNRLAFVGDDRYIGCSKPSCYCCNLYMRFHPGSYLQRPCHGNTWINWCTPSRLDVQTALNMDDTRNIMRRMVEQIRRDLLSQLTSGSEKLWMFDSTTGLSTSVSAPLV